MAGSEEAVESEGVVGQEDFGRGAGAVLGQFDDAEFLEAAGCSELSTVVSTGGRVSAAG